MRISVIGPPGSGKGSQAVLLSKVLSVPRICAGEMLREISKEKNSLGKTTKETLAKGELVPDDLVFTLLKRRLKKSDARKGFISAPRMRKETKLPSAAKGFILDGIPRTLNQAQMYRKLFSLDKVLLLKIDEKTAVARVLRRKREDDTPGAIERRVAIFNREIDQIAKLYRKLGVLVEIDARGDPKEVHRRILAELSSALPNYSPLRLRRIELVLLHRIEKGNAGKG